MIGTEAKLTWEGVKVVVFALCFLALSGVVGWKIHADNKRDARLEALESFKTSVDDQSRVTAAGDGQFSQSQALLWAFGQQQERTIEIHHYETQKASDEDPDVRAWRAGRIPQRLLDADAEARRRSGLGPGDREGGAARTSE